MSSQDLFPPSDFDPWAETYDRDVRTLIHFPFDGYERVLDAVVASTDPQPGKSVLDLGTGTGNLAVRFAERGCDLWCTDFSQMMLDKAREKLPHAYFYLHDLRRDFPAELDRRFDCIVSAYVFHHFELDKKVSLCSELVSRRLAAGGKLIIADLSFPSQQALDIFKQQFDDWDDEFYWLADEAVSVIERIGLKVEYLQVSACAGIYILSA